MTTPLAELLAKVPSINNEAEPFTYEVVGETIVAKWNIVSASYIELRSAGTIDEKYSITVTLKDGKGTYDFNERRTEVESEAEAKPSGKIGLHYGANTFSGKSSAKSFTFKAGGSYDDGSGPSNTLSYSFETSRIKKPLFDFLEANGWTRKKGFLSGLFNS